MNTKRIKNKKEVEEKLKDYTLLEIKIGSIEDKNSVLVTIEPFWDQAKAADIMVDWIQSWCIKTLMEVVSSMLDNDQEKKLLVLHDWLKQMKQLTEDIGKDIHDDDEDDEDNKKKEREKDITDIAKFFKSLLG